jgi:ribosomal protein L12E/L44/L45/RPP1/RPP2
VAAANANADESKSEGAAKTTASASVAASSSKSPEPVDPNYFPPRTVLEKKLASMWRKLFQRPRISTTDDFFTLGGHSLLAAWLVSALRKDPKTEGVTMADVYGHPKLRELACKLEGGDPSELPDPAEEAAQAAANAAAAAAAAVSAGGTAAEGGAAAGEGKDDEDAGDGQDDDGLPAMDANGTSGSNGGGNSAAVDAALLASFAPTSNLRFILCGFVQLLSLYFLYALPALQIGIPWQIYLRIREGGWQYVLIMLLPFSVAVFPCFAFIALGAKWLLIGRYKEGKHKLWGWFYYRHWLVQRLHSYVPLVYLRGSPVLGLYFRLAGAEIGSNVFLNSHWLEAPDLISIGSDSSIGIDAQLINFHVEGNCQKQHTFAACFLSPLPFFSSFQPPKAVEVRFQHEASTRRRWQDSFSIFFLSSPTCMRLALVCSAVYCTNSMVLCSCV